MLEALREREGRLCSHSRELILRKSDLVARMELYDRDIRVREHQVSMGIWEDVKRERRLRKDLLRLSNQVAAIKNLLKAARNRVFWESTVSFQHYNGYILKFWCTSKLSVTGEALSIVDVSDAPRPPPADGHHLMDGNPNANPNRMWTKYNVCREYVRWHDRDAKE